MMKFTIIYTRLFMETVDEASYDEADIWASERTQDISACDFGKEGAKEALTVYDVEERVQELFPPYDKQVFSTLKNVTA